MLLKLRPARNDRFIGYWLSAIGYSRGPGCSAARPTCPDYGRVFLQACARHGVAPELEYPAADLQSLVWLVLANFGVCPYPSSLAFLAPKGLALRPFTPGCPQLNFVLAWAPSEATHALKAFVQHFERFVEGDNRH